MDGENGNPRAGRQGTGRSLREAREGMGLSLQEVEQRTRIRTRYLGALEREEFDVLPAVYVLGSLKTYADFLGLDGAALSRQLKADLVEPEESETPAQIAAGRDEDAGHRAGPAWAVGFYHLFVGMGVILISILAMMTLVAAVARGGESPVSQLDEPSTPEAPSEIALAGNVGDRAVPQPRRANDAPNDEPNAKDVKASEKGGKRREGRARGAHERRGRRRTGQRRGAGPHLRGRGVRPHIAIVPPGGLRRFGPGGREYRTLIGPPEFGGTPTPPPGGAPAPASAPPSPRRTANPLLPPPNPGVAWNRRARGR